MITVAFAILTFLMALIIGITEENQECETVTWYEYDEKKTGQICGKARDQMNAIRDQMGIYKKGDD